MQYGFFFDQSRCTGCRTCTVACKNWHHLPAGPLKYLKVYEYEKGSFPDVRLHFQWVPCYHCEDPACIKTCPSSALHKEPKYGAVLLDSHEESCSGCRQCYDSCPYGAIVFESDDPDAKAQKCDMCFDRLEAGDMPICVLSCSSRALDFGPLSEIKERYGLNSDLEDIPSSKITRPSVIFRPHLEKRQLIPYDSSRAIDLMMRRDPLPAVFTSPEDVLEIPPGMVGRSKLVLKHDSAADLMKDTACDEG